MLEETYDRKEYTMRTYEHSDRKRVQSLNLDLKGYVGAQDLKTTAPNCYLREFHHFNRGRKKLRGSSLYGNMVCKK